MFNHVFAVNLLCRSGTCKVMAFGGETVPLAYLVGMTFRVIHLFKSRFYIDKNDDFCCCATSDVDSCIGFHSVIRIPSPTNASILAHLLSVNAHLGAITKFFSNVLLFQPQNRGESMKNTCRWCFGLSRLHS